MFANDLTVKDRTNADVTFKLIQLEGSESLRKTAGSTLAYPYQMRIARTVQGSQGNGSTQVDRFLVSFSKAAAGTKGPVTLVANLTLAVPRDAAISLDDIKDVCKHIVTFLSNDNIVELQSGGI